MVEREKSKKYEPRKYISKTIKNALSALAADDKFIAGCKFMLTNLVSTGALPENTDLEGLIQEGFLSVFKSACRNKKRRGITLMVDSNLPRNQQTATGALKPYLKKAILNQGLQERRRLKRTGFNNTLFLDAVDGDHDFGITGEGFDTHAGKFHELPRQDRRRIYPNVLTSQNAIAEEASLRERLNNLGRRKKLDKLYLLSGLSRIDQPDLSHWINTLEITAVLTDLYFISANPRRKKIKEIPMSRKYIKALMEEWNEDAMRTTYAKLESVRVDTQSSVRRHRGRRWIEKHVGKENLQEKLLANTSPEYARMFVGFIYQKL